MSITYTLAALGWHPFYEPSWATFSGDDFVPGRIAVEHRSSYVIYTEVGELRAELSGRARHRAARKADLPAVGDWVACRPRPLEGTATIEGVLERRSKFSRDEAGFATDEQIVAANVDVVFLMQSLNGDLNPRRLERYLTMAWGGGTEPVVILTKSDVCADVDAALEVIEPVAVGAPTHVVSNVTGEGVPSLLSHLEGNRTVALLGSSGVGKSSLVNRLLGEERQAVRAIREDDDRGLHTTTRRELILMPRGGLILDTPGMRELQLWDDDGAIDEVFDDIAAWAESCRFRDCSHSSEPGCAVRAAVEEGSLDAGRLKAHNKLQRELRSLAIRKDKRLASEERKKWRRISRAHR